MSPSGWGRNAVGSRTRWLLTWLDCIRDANGLQGVNPLGIGAKCALQFQSALLRIR